MEMTIRERIEQQIFGSKEGRRFTQDSPILTDVWIAFGQSLGASQDLIILPHRDDSSGKIAEEINQNLKELRNYRHSMDESGDLEQRDQAGIAHLPGVIAARLYFDEVLWLVLPHTRWWRERVLDYIESIPDDSEYVVYRHFPGPKNKRAREKLKKLIIADIVRVESRPTNSAYKSRDKNWPAPDLVWTVRLIGYIAAMGTDGVSEDPTNEQIVDAFLDLFEKYPQTGTAITADSGSRVWRVSRNRDALPAVNRSSVACKADAARLLFNVSCKNIVWAIADSGIDSRHPAFHDWRSGTCQSRVIETYDFSKLRKALRLDRDNKEREELDSRALDGLKAADKAFEGNEQATDAAVVKKQNEIEKKLKIKARKTVDELLARLRNGLDVDWALLLPFVQVDNPADDPPALDHGTHVAGILGADWPIVDGEAVSPSHCRPGDNPHKLLDQTIPREMTGMCPDIRLIDLRVLGKDNSSDEFEVIAALQLVRYLNTRAGHIHVHGVNLSLSIEHDVVNYACGRTPICDECDQLAANGTVVVAAAGNGGHQLFSLASGAAVPGYSCVSITDPGNANGAITVGATHRYRPHEYGVSYFSSRGPTGDGRSKPDLVAPGEKIRSCVGDDGDERKDGTSMAAPHVSGAAALLMARHSELIGQPQRVKEALCNTATDLGRERYFQGAGMLDVLRALQSI